MSSRPWAAIVAYGMLFSVVLFGGVALLLSRPQPVQITVNPPQPTPTVTAPGPIVVYITGAIANPGLHTMPHDSRVQVALTSAGGALPVADLQRVNLAQRLRDGDHVHVPAEGEALSTTSAINAASGPQIDLNRADATQLEALPGIGPVIAARIVAYREANGPFTALEQLTNVEGIGEATLSNITPLLRIN